jgi:hypothetical protein
LEEWKTGKMGGGLMFFSFRCRLFHYSIIPFTQERGKEKAVPPGNGWKLGTSCYGIFNGGH